MHDVIVTGCLVFSVLIMVLLLLCVYCCAVAVCIMHSASHIECIVGHLGILHTDV